MQRTAWVARRTLVTLLVGALTLLGATQGYAGTLEAVKARGILVAGVREDFPPLGYLDGTGKPTGFIEGRITCTQTGPTRDMG